MSRKKWTITGLAVFLMLTLGLILLSAPAAIALRLAGFRAQGQTSDYLANNSGQPTIVWSKVAGSTTPTPVGTLSSSMTDAGVDAEDVLASDSDTSQSLDSVKVGVWFLDQPYVFYSQEIFAKRLERGYNDSGDLAYYIAFNQEGVNAYLNYWFGDAIESEARVRNAWLDLRTGSAIVYADVDLEVGWQQVGAVFMLDSSGRQFILAGVDIEGQLYSTPPEGEIAELAQQLETEANRALDSLTFIDPAGELVIRTIQISEDEVQILAY